VINEQSQKPEKHLHRILEKKCMHKYLYIYIYMHKYLYIYEYLYIISNRKNMWIGSWKMYIHVYIFIHTYIQQNACLNIKLLPIKSRMTIAYIFKI
jgi:hypothetical protein